MEYADYPARVGRAFAAMGKAPADPWRPGYHLTPLAGTLGDPNGLCQQGDVFHIFYVTSPLACETDQRTPCVWGHCTTTDFVHYTRQPTAAGTGMASTAARLCGPTGHCFSTTPAMSATTGNMTTSTPVGNRMCCGPRASTASILPANGCF